MNIGSAYKIAFVVIAGLLAGVAAVWYFLLKPAVQAPVQTGQTSTTGIFGQSGQRPSTSGTSGGETNIANGTNDPQSVLQGLYRISSGPVAGATFVQTLNPTTTLARFVMADNGHVFDLPIGVPNTVSRAVSNTTVPGIARTVWAENGSSVLLQYLEGTTVKTLSLGFSGGTASTTGQRPARIRFLPDAIYSLTVSPDGKTVAYLLQSSSGVDGYTAKPDGTGSKKLFSLPLSQVLLSWPAQSTLLAQTRAAAEVPGIAFSINAKTGATQQLVYAPGLTAIANKSFSTVIYQTVPEGGDRSTYAHDIKTGANRGLSFQPFPEKCAWDPVIATILFCAAPESYVPPNYLDLWHQGVGGSADSIFGFNITTGKTAILAQPGKSGGVPSDIAELAVSPDAQYLLYITKGDRSLWAVRIAQ